MDSKPLAIIIAIVVTIGAMGVIIVTGGNILTGTSTTTELLPKTLDVVSIENTHLEVNVLMTNLGSNTIDDVNASLEIDGDFTYRLTANDNIEPYETLSISGSVKGPANITAIEDNRLSHIWGLILDHSDEEPHKRNTNGDGTQNANWDVYSGETVLLRISGSTTSGDTFEKIYQIIVK